MNKVQVRRKRQKYYQDALQLIRPVAEYAYEQGAGELTVRVFGLASVRIEVEHAPLSGRLYVVLEDDQGTQVAFTNQFDAAEALAEYMLDLHLQNPA